MEDVGKFYIHSAYFSAISYILRQFGKFCGHFDILFPFWYVVPRKIWQPCPTAQMFDGVKFKSARTKRPITDNFVGCFSGLPDDIFSNQKIPIWANLGGSCNGRGWYILWPFGIFYGTLVYYDPFIYLGMLYQDKSGNLVAFKYIVLHSYKFVVMLSYNL
jgi:hypothetical protein